MTTYLYSIHFLSSLLSTLELMRNNRDADSYNRLLVSLGDLVQKSREDYFRSLASPLVDACSDDAFSADAISSDGLPF